MTTDLRDRFEAILNDEAQRPIDTRRTAGVLAAFVTGLLAAERNDLVTRALAFATAAHAAVGQLRKYTNEPYVLHPIAVAEIVRSVPHDDAMVAAALLHDVVEDTAVDLDLINEVFGADVADLVGWLTDIRGPGNRAERKSADRERLAGAQARAQTIKVADLIHNTASIVERDPDFARVYMREKEALLDVLISADWRLRQRALDQLADYKRGAA